MRNWSVDENHLKKFPKKYILWKLEQLLSYGLDGEKIDKKQLIKLWPLISPRLDVKRREYLQFLLWNQF